MRNRGIRRKREKRWAVVIELQQRSSRMAHHDGTHVAPDAQLLFKALPPEQPRIA